MKKTHIILFSVIVSALLFSCAGTAGKSPDPEKLFPVDPKVTAAQLENGLTYYIRQNKKPENAAELWLAVKAGSINEDEDQRGLAHFCEHMAFNGTEDYPGDSIIKFLESIGMKFGPEVNANTSFERTLYMLQVPMDNPEHLETAVHILSQWAAHVSYDPEEIDKERGVITEEWRLGRGYRQRIWDKHVPVLYHDSLYAERRPIGDMDIVQNCPYDALTRFYKDWYRPDLMSVIAVGDFEPAQVEELIKKYFAPLENPENERPQVRQKIPAHKETLVSIVSDPEAQYPIFEYYKKYPDYKFNDFDSYRSRVNHWLIMKMAELRLAELKEKDNTPVLYISMDEDHYLKDLRTARLAWVPDSSRINEAMKSVLEVYERMKRYGFYEAELERAKNELLGIFRTSFNEKDTTHSYQYLYKYFDNFLFGTEFPGIEWKYDYIQKLLPEISLAEIQKESEILFSEEDRVFLVSIPDSLKELIPSEQDILSIISEMKEAEVEEIKIEKTDTPLVPEIPANGSISEIKELKSINARDIRLSNGMRIILKPTDFKSDEIRFSAFSPGGASLVDDSEYSSSQVSVDLATAGGLGSFKQTDLQKELAGKLVSVEPFLEELVEGFKGNSTKADLETAFQLIYLYFTSPRIDNTAMKNFLDRVYSVYENRESNPDAYFSDQYEYLLHGKHYRYRPVTTDVLDEINPDDAIRIYKERFADAGDFTFIFTGSFTFEEIMPLIARYLASLPDLPGKELWKDRNDDYFKGSTEKNLYKGRDEKSTAVYAISGEYEWKIKTNFYLQRLKDALEIEMREEIREDEGGTYDVGVYVSYSHYPDQEYCFQFSFGCAPDRAEELLVKIKAILEKTRKGIDDDVLTRVIETTRKGYERAMRENYFWLNELQKACFHGYSPEEIPKLQQLIDNFDKKEIEAVADKFLNPENTLQLILYPEKYSPDSAE